MALLGAALALAGPAGAALALAGPADAATSPFAKARLAGQFSMLGRVTVASQIQGERAGEKLGRVWTFTPLCATGACAQVRLVRNRAGGADAVILNQTAPGSYSGSGRFYAPLLCAGKTYPKGESVPFRITVKITAASATGAATAVSSTYTNRSRRNLTRCVDIPGHDAATYTGQLAAPSTGGGGA